MENVVIVNDSSKGSRRIRKIVMAILGLLVLIVGVLAGTLLVRENQDFRERAAEIPISTK